MSMSRKVAGGRAPLTQATSSPSAALTTRPFRKTKDGLGSEVPYPCARSSACCSALLPHRPSLLGDLHEPLPWPVVVEAADDQVDVVRLGVLLVHGERREGAELGARLDVPDAEFGKRGLGCSDIVVPCGHHAVQVAYSMSSSSRTTRLHAPRYASWVSMCEPVPPGRAEPGAPGHIADEEVERRARHRREVENGLFRASLIRRSASARQGRPAGSGAWRRAIGNRLDSPRGGALAYCGKPSPSPATSRSPVMSYTCDSTRPARPGAAAPRPHSPPTSPSPNSVHPGIQLEPVTTVKGYAIPA
jgi:hypothetical protein